MKSIIQLGIALMLIGMGCQSSEFDPDRFEREGGVVITMQVSVPDLLREYSGNSARPAFLDALEQARELTAQNDEDFLTNFYESALNEQPNVQLSQWFVSRDYQHLFSANATNEEVLTALKVEIKAAIDRSAKVLQARCNSFGVSAWVVPISKSRIELSVMGTTDLARLRKIVQVNAKLEFWETHDKYELAQWADEANTALRKTLSEERDDTIAAWFEGYDVLEDTGAEDVDQQLLHPWYALVSPPVLPTTNGGMEWESGGLIGRSLIKDTALVNSYIQQPALHQLFPARTTKLLWAAKPENGYLALYAIKVTSTDGRAPLDGSVIVDASVAVNNYSYAPEVVVNMNEEGTRLWHKLTMANVKQHIAVVVDDLVYMVPIVQEPISAGRTSISLGAGNQENMLLEAEDLANVLKSGTLPVPIRIVEEKIIGSE